MEKTMEKIKQIGNWLEQHWACLGGGFVVGLVVGLIV